MFSVLQPGSDKLPVFKTGIFILIIFSFHNNNKKYIGLIKVQDI